MQLVIQQTDGAAGPLFCVRNGVTSTKPVSLPDPSSYPVQGYDGKRLLKELAWYLEHYLDFPAGADAKRAEAVMDTLQAWGGEVFDALFTQKAYAWYSAARVNLDELEIKIESASPAVLSWPWEALYSGDDGYLAQHCCMERQPPDLDLPLREVQEGIGELHVLFIVSRPDTENKVGYHNLEREVIRYIRDEGRAVTVDVLRPPTFKRLREVLQERPGYYHIVHFDGHGGYGPVQTAGNTTHSGKTDGRTVTVPTVSGGPAKYQGMEGQLIFETDGAGEDAVGAEKLGSLLTQCGVPMMVLNACQSAMIDGQAGDPFASVAARLLKAGIPSVTAMGYSLYVSGAKQFVPAFYEALFRDGGPAGAMRAGRQAMYARPERPCYYGECPLQDWIVPELYQQIPAGARLLPKVGQAAARRDTFPPELRTIGDYGLIGRGKEIHDLERILQRNRQAGILIHGMAGAGKTTLAKGFLHWLRDTSGLRESDGTDCPVFWFEFQKPIQSTDAVFHPLADALLGETARTLDETVLLETLTDVLKRRRVFMVWDNFESASGIPGTEVAAFLSEKDQKTLKSFLHALRGGKSRVFITSRQKEDWLSVQECARLETLGGLDEDECWDYCREVVRDKNLTIDRNDGDMKDLLNRLDGNPLALRAILLRLGEGRTARDLLKELDTTFTGATGDAGTEQMLKAFHVLMSDVDPALAPVLQAIGLHEHFAYERIVGNLFANKEQAKPGSPEAQKIIDRVAHCFQILENAGLCINEGTNMCSNLYRLHPALRSCLSRMYPADEDVRRSFVQDLVYSEQKFHNDVAKSVRLFKYYEASFLHAKVMAEELEMKEEDLGLTFGLAVYAMDCSRTMLALERFEELAEKAHRYRNFDMENRAYHALACISNGLERKLFLVQKAAKMWDDAEELTAEAYFVMGKNAEGQGNLPAAEENYGRALAIWKRDGDIRAVAVYGELGNLATQQGDAETARTWYQKEWEKSKDLGYLEAQANASQCLGHIAALQGDVKEALERYQEAMTIYQHIQNHRQIAETLKEIGQLLNDIGAYDSAKEYLMESIRIADNIGTGAELLAVENYNSLGYLSVCQNDFTSAKLWFEKALFISEKCGYEECASIARNNLEGTAVLAAEYGG